jgi:hypothetical protein
MKRMIVTWLLIFAMAPSLTVAQTGGTVVLKDIDIPENLSAGDAFQVSFRVENSWYLSMREVYVFLEGGFPFLEKSPTEAQFILRLLTVEPWKRSDRITFNLSVDEDTKAGIYPLNVVVTYRIYSDTIGLRGGYGRVREVIPLQIKVGGTPKLALFVTKSNPIKVRAGDVADLGLSVVNMGSERAKNVLVFTEPVEGVDVFWFSRGFYVGDIQPQDAGRASVKVDVDDYAPSGEYTLPVRLVYETPDGERMEEGTSIKLVVEDKADYRVTPVSNSVLSGTNENQVTFNLENTGTKEAKEVKVILKASYPFTPTGNEYFVGRLEPGEAKEISFHVDVDSDADTQPYPVDVIIQWKEDTQDYTKSKATFIHVTHVESRDMEYLGYLLGTIVLLAVLKKLVSKIKKRGG